MPKILKEYIQRTTRNSAQGAKESISKGLSPRLKKSTIEIRRQRGRGGSKPLLETGALHRSIKGTSEGLEMLSYGIHHQYGFTPKQIPFKVVKGEREWFIPNTKNIKVPARPFIFPSEKTISKSLDAFREDLHRALKK
jgi:hypothetical protein|tara:strand:+ start:233 stop:646 length:414 start_codon:yes stop_codon:yes gene_type:complete